MPPKTRDQRLQELGRGDAPPAPKEKFTTFYNGPTDQVPSQSPKSRATRLKELQGHVPTIMQATGVINRTLNGTNSRISNNTAILIVGIALFIDIIEMVVTWEVIGVIVSYATFIFANLTFWFIFRLHNVSIWIGSPKKFVTSFLMSLGELVPGFDAIPLLSFLWTIGVLIIIIQTRLEDKTGFKLPTSLTSPKKAVTGTIKET